LGSRKSIVFLFISIFGTLLFSCQSVQQKSETVEFSYELIDSTAHFRIDKASNHFRLKVKNPFVGSDAEENYVFYPRDSAKPKGVSAQHFIPTPVNSLVITSSTHLGYLKALNKETAIAGAKNLGYAYDRSFLEQLESGEIVDLGEAEFNREKLIALNADAVFAYAIDGAAYREVDNLRRLNQSAVMLAEFMESDPIAKAKWLEVVALFFGEKELASAKAQIQAIENRYYEMQKLAKQADNKPKVMIGLPWKGTWYVAGGKSFQAKLIEDANAEYLWKEKGDKASLPLDIEYVFEHALTADFWMNPGPAKSLNDILERDHRFDAFQAFQKGKVFNQNRRLSASGGNDYWESAVVKPDVILADLIAIFHPQLLPNHELYYYQNIE
tara:strand:+ start:10780 stop:11931 length:1152 start_codon:yes stop_codon:yes gene_type:complete